MGDGVTTCYELSVVIPAKNEAENLRKLLPELLELLPNAEVIVVDDGSTDATQAVLEKFQVKSIKHPVSLGNGAAIKSGARASNRDYIVFMDGDGQHDPSLIPKLLKTMSEGYDMVVGARSARSQASFGRLAANGFYNRMASWMVGHKIADLTSGFRVVEADRFREFLYMLPNGFSYPTTCTMAFFRAGYPVAYVPFVAQQRVGQSHIRLVRDGIRFLLIIFKIGTLYSPLKLFLPISLVFFGLGAGYYGYTFSVSGRFTNMSALLFITSTLIFLMGLISEQITNLSYNVARRE
jgi:glycosyltransferase involved in cell wall biosynthesis